MSSLSCKEHLNGIYTLSTALHDDVVFPACYPLCKYLAMKTIQISSFITLALVGVSNAYPSIMEHLAREAQQKQAKRWGLPSFKKEMGKRQLTVPPFDPTTQYVSNTGAHAFVAPGSGDQRGPCPGLNAMANQ